MSTDRRELLELLDRLCESRLSPDEHARLEELASANDEALQLYLNYVTLHGTLHWDTAVSEDDVPGDVRPAESSGYVRPAARIRRWAVTVAACTALLVGAFALTGPHTGEELVDHNGDPEGTSGTLSDSTLGQGDETEQPPRVRLDPREDPPRQLADGGGRTSEGTGSAVPDAAATEDLVAFIDAQLAAAWDAEEIAPAPLADDAEWVRRASLDLAGRIPDVATVREFLDADDPYKREQYVARLLRGGDFAGHFTTVWANLLVGRGKSTAHERHGLEQFLLSQFRQNRPWNETVGELIAAEGSVDENGAAGFLLAHLNNEAVPATAITARLFLGEQVQCSQCHKHPWNDESQEQFWNLNAFFKQTKIQRRQETDPQTGRPRNVPVLVTKEIGGPSYYENRRGVMQVAYPKFGEETIAADASVNRRRELARLLASEDDYQLARAFVNRMWAHFFGFGFVNPVDDMGAHKAPTHPELLDRLSREFVRSGYDVGELVRWITSSRAYQLTSRRADGETADDPAVGDPPLFSRMYVKSLAPEQVFESVLVATNADRAGNRYGEERLRRREAWVQQFFDVLENEENGEVSLFDGTLPQALTMMNGPLVEAALSGEPGTVLHRVTTSSIPEAEKVRTLCLAALSREPTRRERNLFTRHVRQAESPAAKADALRDVFWAYLNSGEFVMNH